MALKDNKPAEALAQLQKSHALLDRLTKQDPGSTTWKSDLEVVPQTMAEVRKGDPNRR